MDDAFDRTTEYHPSKERAAHSAVNVDGSFLSSHHLRKRPAACDRVCSGNARIEIGRPPRESTLVAGRNAMKKAVKKSGDSAAAVRKELAV